MKTEAMKPIHPDHRSDQSSDSDEDSNIRHDRFRSERFQEGNKTSNDTNRSCDSYRNKRYRDKSPLRTSKHKETISFTSFHREESRNKQDSRDKYKGHCSKYRKSKRHEGSVHEKKHSQVNECEIDNVVQTSKLKLSSLLKNFDKKVEEKRNNLERTSETESLNFKQECHERQASDDSIIGETPIGPALPPSLRNVCENKTEDFSKCGSDRPNPMMDIGVALPPHLIKESKTNSDVENANNETVSMIHPSHTKNSQSSEYSTEKKNLEMSSSPVTVKEMDVEVSVGLDMFGPALPQKTEEGVYGPSLPPKVEIDSYGPALPPNFKKSTIQGPSLPSEGMLDQLEVTQEVSEDEDMVGPLPEGQMNITQYQLDLRAKHIKKQLEEEKSGSSKDIKKREEWMLELPPEKATNLGLGPRSFRMREAPDMSNRSSWTDTPADKLRKEELALRGESEPVNSEEMMKSAFVRERDEAMDKMSQLIQDEDRPHSLLELHQKKLKKKKKKEKKEGKKKERRPFDRNIDLQVNRFDEAQKKAIFKKAQLLDTRFSSGESKYL